LGLLTGGTILKRGQLYAFVTGIFFLSMSILGFIPQLQHSINAVEVHNELEIQLGYLFGLFVTHPVLNTVYAIVRQRMLLRSKSNS